MKITHYGAAVFAVSAVYSTVSLFVILMICMKHFTLFGVPSDPMTAAEIIALIAVIVLFFLLMTGILHFGKRRCTNWRIKECILTLLCFLAGIPAGYLALRILL